MIIEFFLGTALTTVAVPLSIPMVPIAVAQADKVTGRLQPRHRWLETPDALGWGAGTYEPEIKAIYDKRGKEAALRAWLLRNKAYGLRYSLRAKVNPDTMTVKESGSRVPPKVGPWYWYARVTDKGRSYFELRQGVSFSKAHVYVRYGWNLKPWVEGYRPAPGRVTSAGIFNGITVRSDDWDDYEKRNARSR